MVQERRKPVTVGDILGAPDTWRDVTLDRETLYPDLLGATISEVESIGDGIAISTVGARGGSTYSVFHIENADIRQRMMRVLKPGLAVFAAVLLAI